MLELVIKSVWIWLKALMTHIHLWLIHVNVWQNPPQYCKVISLQLKLKNKKLNIQKAKKEDLICKVFKEFIQLNIKTIA